MIPVYGYPPEGELIAQLISYNEKKEPDHNKILIRDKILDIIQRLLSRYDSYIADFVVRLYLNAREKGFSDSIIKTLSKILHDNVNGRNRCTNVIGALNLCLYHHLEEEPHKHAFFDLWVKTINDFNPEIRKIILYHHKAENENLLGLCQPPKYWEKMWLENLHDFSKIVLYGICAKCREEYPLIVDYYKYQRERVTDGHLRTNCNRCRTEGSFYVSSDILRNPPRTSAPCSF
ncbi:MAG TPA: hypothetical protein VFI73_11805 [Candidatus Nitrosopolaris sp.]|nr:hypothetical protein [Candidatus Nitrosopolaris sp.]